jgi:hypothetical protein
MTMLCYVANHTNHGHSCYGRKAMSNKQQTVKHNDQIPIELKVDIFGTISAPLSVLGMEKQLLHFTSD